MHTNKTMKLAVVTFLGISLAAAGTAVAGRGSSPAAIQRAIASGSSDAIKAELERAEHLVCFSCVDMVRPLVDNQDQGIRQVAAWWLARRSAAGTVRVDMLTRLSQPDSVAARNAADVLGEFHYVSSIPALAAALSNPIYSGEARAHMASALGRINRPAVVAPLTAALGDSNVQVQVAAMKALQSIPGLRDGSALSPLLTNADVGVRAEAATTLGMFHDASGTNALVTALQSDASPIVRRNAAWALGEIHANSAVAGPALQNAAANDASPFVRSIAGAAVTKLSSASSY
jgi:HEAT repeat protein